MGHPDHNRFTLKFIAHKDELIDYINNKNGNDRKDDPIRNFTVFSHGFGDGTISLGYNYSSYNEDLDFGISDIERISSEAFENPISIFYSCNTGTGDNSFAQNWVNKVGGDTWAFSGYTWYGDINTDASKTIKLSRFLHGFSYYGSANYPIGHKEAKKKKFTKK